LIAASRLTSTIGEQALMSLETPPTFASNHNGVADGTDTLVDTSHANGHLNVVATLTSPEPSSDESAFALLMAAAESVGRLDLAEEFRKRARESNKPAAPEKPAPTAASSKAIGQSNATLNAAAARVVHPNRRTFVVRVGHRVAVHIGTGTTLPNHPQPSPLKG